MIDVERLARAHYAVQVNHAWRTHDAAIARGDKPGAVGHYIRTTPWEELPTALQDIRRSIALELIEAYEALDG